MLNQCSKSRRIGVGCERLKLNTCCIIAAASRLLALSTALDLDVCLVARAAASTGTVLLLPPHELRARLHALQQVTLI
jgi:hypothetical protein